MPWMLISEMPFACPNPKLQRRHALPNNPWYKTGSSSQHDCLSFWTKRYISSGGKTSVRGGGEEEEMKALKAMGSKADHFKIVAFVTSVNLELR